MLREKLRAHQPRACCHDVNSFSVAKVTSIEHWSCVLECSKGWEYRTLLFCPRVSQESKLISYVWATLHRVQSRSLSLNSQSFIFRKSSAVGVFGQSISDVCDYLQPDPSHPENLGCCQLTELDYFSPSTGLEITGLKWSVISSSLVWKSLHISLAWSN